MCCDIGIVYFLLLYTRCATVNTESRGSCTPVLLIYFYFACRLMLWKLVTNVSFLLSKTNKYYYYYYFVLLYLNCKFTNAFQWDANNVNFVYYRKTRLELKFVIYLLIAIYLNWILEIFWSFNFLQTLCDIYKTERKFIKGIKLVLSLVWSISKKFLKWFSLYSKIYLTFKCDISDLGTVRKQLMSLFCNLIGHKTTDLGKIKSNNFTYWFVAYVSRKSQYKDI